MGGCRRDSGKGASKSVGAVAVLLAIACVLVAGAACSASNIDADQQEQSERAIEGFGAPAEQGGFADAPESTGDPLSVFQLSEVLALDSADIPTLFDGWGLVRSSELPEDATMGDVASRWNLPADGSVFRSQIVDPAGEFFDFDQVARFEGAAASETYVQVGIGLTTLTHESDSTPTVVSPEALQAGWVPDSIVIGRIPLRFDVVANGETLFRFTESCGVGGALSVLSLDESTSSQQAVAVGFANCKGEPMMWHLMAYDYGAMFGEEFSTTGSFACCSLSVARSTVTSVGLFTGEDFDAASDADKAAMLAKSLLQDANTGNGGVRRNFETGTIEALEQTTAADGTYAFVWNSCSLQANADTGSEEIVSDVTGQSYGPLSAWSDLEQGVERGWYSLR